MTFPKKADTSGVFCVKILRFVLELYYITNCNINYKFERYFTTVQYCTISHQKGVIANLASNFSIKLSVSATDLIASIRQTIDEINSKEKLKNKPLHLSASVPKLTASIKSAIAEINRSHKLDSKPINLKVKLNANEAIKSLQKELSSLTLKTGGVNIKNPALTQSINSATNAIKAEGAAVQTVNNLLKDQITLFTKSGDVKQVQTFGTAGNTVANSYLNGTLTSQTKTTDYARQDREADKAYAAYSRLDSIVNKLQADFTNLNSTKPIQKQANIDELNTALTETRNKIEAVKTASAESFSRLKADAESSVKALELLIKTKQNEEYAASALRAKDVPTIKAIQTSAFDELKAKINSSRVPLSALSSDLAELQKLLNNITDRKSLTAYLNQFSIVESKFDSLKAKAKETSDFSKQVQKDLNKLSKLTNGTIFKNNETEPHVVALRQQIASLTEQYKTLQAASAQASTPEQMSANIETLRALQVELDRVVQSTGIIRENLKNTRIDNNLQTKITALNAQITDFITKNGKVLNKINPITGNSFGTDLKNLQAALPTAQSVETFTQLNNQFSILRANIKSAGLEGNTLFTDMVNKAGKFISWFATTQLIMRGRMYFNQLFTTVLTLDESLVDLRKTFNGSAQELEDFYFESNKLAKQLGVTTDEIIKQGSAFSRLGFSSNETMKQMAKMSSMFAAISPDMNTDQATDGLVSIMKAFDIAPDNVLDGILSKVNIVGNTAATSNGEIVEMLKRSSAALREGNNTLEQAIALGVASIEVTRDFASTGTAWKTIAARLRGLDEETLEVTEDVEILSGKFADLTKTAKTPGGISLFTDASKSTYKSTYQIIKELSEIWDDLSDVNTAKIGELIGGKRQLQTVSAAIENFEAAEKAMDNMANSAGNAEAEMEIVRESAAYALNEMKETFTALAQNSVTREFLKDLIHTGTKSIEVVDKLVSSFGALPTVLGVVIGQIASINSIKNKGLFKFDLSGGLTFQGARNPQEWFGNLKTGFASIFTGKSTAFKSNLSLIHQINSALATNADVNELCAKAENSNSAAVRELGQKLKDGTATTSSCIAATKQLGVEAKNASIGVKALNAAVAVGKTVLTMFATTLISMLIGKVIKAIDDSIHAIENLNKEFKDLASESKSIADELESINEQLKDTDERIRELEKLPKLTLLQKDELTALKAYNEELERQRKQRENEARKNQIDAGKDAKKLAKKIFLADYDIRIPKNDIIDNNIRLMEAEIASYKRLSEELRELENADIRDDIAIGKKQDEIAKLEDKLLDYSTSWQNIADYLNPSDKWYKKIKEEAKSLLEQWNEIYNPSPKSFLDIYDSAKFARVHDALQQLAKDGELTAEKFDELNDTDIDGIEDFKKALEEIGVTNAAEIVESIIVNVEDLDKKTNEGKDSIKDYADALEELYDILDKIIGKQEKLSEAFKKTRLGNSLSADEVYELSKEMPNILKYLEKTDDGYTISTDGFNAISNENIGEEKEKLRKSIVETKTQIALLDSLQKAALDVENSSGKDSGLIKHFTELSDVTEELRESLGIESMGQIGDGLATLKEKLKEDELYFDVISSAFDKGAVDFYSEAKSKISDLNGELRTFDSAVKSLNEGNTLSYDEMVEIVELAPELQDFFTEMQDGYTISADKITEWRKKSLEARNEYIQGLIDQAQAEIEAAESSKQASEIILNLENKFGNAADQLKAQIDVQAADKKIKDLRDLVEKYEALMENLKTPEEDKGDNDTSDELQNRIDHYKTIIEAVSAVRDKYAEVLDNEIDALQDSKDALKDANDERQRELDLIEARNNLENAKKRKVYVYSEGEGFKQVQDQKAVKEAEEKYRDVITDIQEAEIDKAIDERENKKKALDDKIKDLINAEENIQNAMIISQAMKEYGLTDAKDLLTLPDDVKQGIIEGLAESTLQKDIEDNKENDKYTEVTLQSLLKQLGSTKNIDDIDPSVFNNMGKVAQDNAVKGFVDNVQAHENSIVNNTINNPNVTNNFVINDATDPMKVKEVVADYMQDFLRQYCDSIK